MKTLRFIGMALVAIIMSVNFVACGDDDDDIDLSQLEGTWGLVHEYYEGKNGSWSDSYDPMNPTAEYHKMIISKVSDNTYSVVSYQYYKNQWEQSTDYFTLDGNSIINSEGESGKILTVNSNELVLEYRGTNEDGDFYYKDTYKRL